MKIKDKVVVVTGGASGIGEALCRRFAKEGARAVVVSDVNGPLSETVAQSINGLAFRCDVRQEEEVKGLVNFAEETCGSIDFYCSNAGIIAIGGVEAANDEWQRIWEINVMAHVYAGRAVIPKMIERGGGAFMITASAAGLLSQIGSAPYSVTKHAAVGLAENLSITYGDQGIKVFALCPQAVRTAMAGPDGGVAAVDGLMEPAQLAESVIEGLDKESFLILPHPEVKTYMERKVSDYDRWLQGMRRLQARFLSGQALKK
ncbi:MAG TPA: SDR family oxidoreductase [Thermodesulfobacteriota bacterium]|nr:SDR family oxidoreductase [Thermodesulfobacteriota bacterium]